MIITILEQGWRDKSVLVLHIFKKDDSLEGYTGLVLHIF